MRHPSSRQTLEGCGLSLWPGAPLWKRHGPLRRGEGKICGIKRDNYKTQKISQFQLENLCENSRGDF